MGGLFRAPSKEVNVADGIVKQGSQEAAGFPTWFRTKKMAGKHHQWIFEIMRGFDTISWLKDETGSRPQNVIRSSTGHHSAARENHPEIEVAKGRGLPAPDRFAMIKTRLPNLDRKDGG
jgi:hypothetical protein